VAAGTGSRSQLCWRPVSTKWTSPGSSEQVVCANLLPWAWRWQLQNLLHDLTSWPCLLLFQCHYLRRRAGAVEDAGDGTVAREEGECSHVGISAGKMDPNWGGQKRTDCELWYELITQLCS
jgi:hypothetical protein